jgi:hypothetical protein
MKSEEILKHLLEKIASIEVVQSIGISGGELGIPEAGQGDIDIFIYCRTIPDEGIRNKLMNQLQHMIGEIRTNVFAGGHWGVGDFTLINGVETWLMYFTILENDRYLDSILKGVHPDKVDNYFYPVGRCAMLKDISIMLDKEKYLETMKRKLAVYPEELKVILTKYHREKLVDVEDLKRAVGRGDVLFYHFAIDNALDHFLQALFAVNRTYFPSRKRSLQLIDRFDHKPACCSEKLLEIIRLAGMVDGMEESYKLWTDLVAELQKCIDAERGGIVVGCVYRYEKKVF